MDMVPPNVSTELGVGPGLGGQCEFRGQWRNNIILNLDIVMEQGMPLGISSAPEEKGEDKCVVMQVCDFIFARLDH